MCIWAGAVLCIFILIAQVTVINADGVITRPGHVKRKIVLGFISNLEADGKFVTFNATRLTFYVSFRPLTIKHYDNDDGITVEVSSMRFRIITKFFVFIVAGSINAPDVIQPYTTCILEGKEIDSS